MFLENTQIKLRAVEPEDLELLYKWENESQHWMHGSTLSPFSKLTLRQYINDAVEMDIYQSKQLRLMIDTVADGITVGTIDLYDFDIRNKRAGVGILIDSKYRNRRYAATSLDIVKQYVFRFLDIHQLYAYISVSNTASIRLFASAGYEPAGVLKNWIFADGNYKDVRIVQLIKDKN